MAEADFKPIEKIFIDTNEEITFVIEKIRESENSDLLIVVPQHAILTSSLVNLKLVARQLSSIGKTAILITSNEVALNKISETKLIAVEKTEEVTQEKWEEAKRYSDELTQIRKAKRDQLLSSRTPTGFPVSVEEKRYEAVQAKDEKDENLHENTLINTEKHSPKKTRIEAKVVRVGPFVVLGAGDIKSFQTSDIYTREIEKVKVLEQAEEKFMPAEKTIISKSAEKIDPVLPTFKSHFIGKDVASIPSHSTQPRNVQNFKPQQRVPQSQNSYTSGGSGKPGIIMELFKKKTVRLLLFVIIVTAGMYWIGKNFLENVTIDISTQSQKVSITEEVKGMANISSIDEANKQIPVLGITKTMSLSDTGAATKKEKRGTFSKGSIDFYNRTDKSVTLKKGTKLTTLSGNLNFILDADVILKPRVSEMTFYNYMNAPITAENYGEEYNISSVDVKVNGFDSKTEVYGHIYHETKGGTTKEVTVVSQEDVDKLKSTMIETMKSLLQKEIKDGLQSSDILLAGIEKYKENAFEVSPAVGQEAERFDITKLEYEITSYVVRQDDIDNLANALMKKNNGSADIANSNKAAKIKSPTLATDGSIQMQIEKEGLVQPSVNIDEVKALIKGKELKDAEIELKKLDYVSSFKVNYSPFFIPASLRSIPTDKDKITINIKS